MAQLYTQRQVTPDSWDMSGDPQHTSIALSVAATINYSADPSHPDILPANTLALLPDGTSVSFDRTADVYIPYVIKGDPTLRIIKESLLPTLTSDYAPLARVELHGIKPYQPEPYLAAGGLGGGGSTSVVVLVSDTASKARSLWNGSTNDAPPASWYTSGFDDSLWGHATLSQTETGLGFSSLPATHLIWSSNPGLAMSEEALLRSRGTLPAGALSAATIEVLPDIKLVALYVNGVAVGSLPFDLTGIWNTPTVPAHPTFDIPLGALVAGGPLLVAALVQNDIFDTSGGWAFKVTATYGGGGGLPDPGGAEGDLIYYHAGAWARLPIGATSQELTVVSGDPAWATPPAAGTVTSVDVAAPSPLASSGGPITTSGTITLSWATGQTANRVLASPNGATGAVSLRALVGNDIPVDASTIISSAGVIKGNYQAGSGVTISGNTISATGSGGTVTSVALSMPGIFSVSGSPVTGSGTLAVTLATETANTVFAGPASGSAAPTFRALAGSDLPAAPGAGGNVHAHSHFR